MPQTTNQHKNNNFSFKHHWSRTAAHLSRSHTTAHGYRSQPSYSRILWQNPSKKWCVTHTHGNQSLAVNLYITKPWFETTYKLHSLPIFAKITRIQKLYPKKRLLVKKTTKNRKRTNNTFEQLILKKISNCSENLGVKLGNRQDKSSFAFFE